MKGEQSVAHASCLCVKTFNREYTPMHTNKMPFHTKAQRRERFSGFPDAKKSPSFAAQILCFAVWLCFAVSLQAADPITHSISLTPAQPKDQWQVDLSPEQTAQLTVTIAQTGAAQGGQWKLRGTPQLSISGDNILWTGTMSGLSGVFSAVNTAPGTTTTRVEVSCEWIPDGTGGGGGGPPPVIEGLATGVAVPGVAHVSWSFHPLRQLADGTSAINWAIYFYDSEGEPVESTVIDQVWATSLNPGGAGWGVSPASGSGATLAGSVTSSDVSTGRLSVRYSGVENAVSDSVLSFGAGPWLEIYTPLE